MAEQCSSGPSTPQTCTSADSDEDDLPITQPVPILKGVVAYVEVRSGHENRSKAISRELLQLGATIESKLSKDVTHVVFREGRQGTVDKARKRKLHIVSVLWVDSCKRSQSRVAEKLYPAHQTEENPLTPRTVAKLRKSKSMQPTDYEEDVSRSAERVAAKNRRAKKTEYKPRYCVLDTPAHQKPRFFVEDTCPQSPGYDSPMFSPSLVIPETPPSMKAKLDSLRKAKMLIKQEEEQNYKASPLAAPADAEEPLHRRLFSSGGASTSQEMQSEDPLASSPLFISGSSSASGTNSNPLTISPFINHVVSMLESPQTETKDKGKAVKKKRRTLDSPQVDKNTGKTGKGRRKSSVSYKESPLATTLNSPKQISSTLMKTGRFFASPVMLSDTSAEGRLDGSSKDDTVDTLVTSPKSAQSPPSNSSKSRRKSTTKSSKSDSTKGSSGKKKLLALHVSPSPELIAPVSLITTTQVASPRKKIVVRKRAKNDVPVTKDPSVLFSRSSKETETETKSVTKTKTKKRKQSNEDNHELIGEETEISKKRVKLEKDPVDVTKRNQKSKEGSSITNNRRKSSRLAVPRLADISEMSEQPSVRDVQTPSPARSDSPKDTRRKSPRLSYTSPAAPKKETIDPDADTDLRNQSGEGHCSNDGVPNSIQSNKDVSKRPLVPSGKNRRSSVGQGTPGQGTPNRRRSTRFITISSGNPANDTGGTSQHISGYEDSMTDVSALNTQNDTLQPSIGTRKVMQEIVTNKNAVENQRDILDDTDISSVDPNLDNESEPMMGNEIFSGVVANAVARRRCSVEIMRVNSRNSMKSLSTTPMSILDQDITGDSPNLMSSTRMNSSTLLSITNSRRSIDEFSLSSDKKLSSRKKSSATKGKNSNKENSYSASSSLSNLQDTTNNGVLDKIPFPALEENNDSEDTTQSEATSEAYSGVQKRVTKKKREKKIMKMSKGRKHHWKQVTIEHSPHTPPSRSLVMTSLHFDEQDTVCSVVERLGGFNISEQVKDSTTHVICGGPRRTLNVLHCISRGCWLLSYSWVLESLEAGHWLQEDQYEVDDYFPAAKLSRLESQQRSQSMGLFKSQGAICVSDTTRPPKHELESLIKLCGGKVTNSIKNAKLCVSSVSNPHVITVNEQWVLDSITNRRTMPIHSYRFNHPALVERQPSPDF